MKKLILISMLLLLLTGCTNETDYTDLVELDNLKNQVKELSDLITEQQSYISDLNKKLDLLYDNDFEESFIDLQNQLNYLDTLVHDMSDESFNMYVQIRRNEKYISLDHSGSFIKGYLNAVDESSIMFDAVEWIHDTDIDRIQQLNIPDNSFPNGYYIYNENEVEKKYELGDEVDYYMVEGSSLVWVPETEFIDRAKTNDFLCQIYVINGKVYEVSELYRP